MKKSTSKVRNAFLEGIGFPKKTEFKVDTFQREAIDYFVQGFDTLVVAPTGSGKTYIATEAMSATLELNCSAVYTTPLKALSNTKYNEFKIRFEPDHNVGLLTGDRKIDGDADCVIATTEIYRNELYRGEGRFSLVVLDEVHFIADSVRGPVWEESIIMTPPDATLLMLSASISNPEEIAAWIQDVRGKECKIVQKEIRPVELRFGFLHPDLGVLPLETAGGNIYKAVKDYYGSARLDESGRRLIGGPFERGHAGGGKKGRNTDRKVRGQRRRGRKRGRRK